MDPEEEQMDLQLLAPSDGLLDRLVVWNSDPEKWFWNAGFEVDDHLCYGTMKAIKILMEADAVEGRNVLNLGADDKDTVVFMEELERLGVAVRKGGISGHVTSWQLLERSATTLEPVTRVFKKDFAMRVSATSKTSSALSVFGPCSSAGRGGLESQGVGRFAC
jgi:hypothetical protein